MKHRYRNLKIWQLGIEIADDVYRLLEHFPMEEKFGLVSQISRSSVSIPSNIAEGSAMTDQSFNHYVNIALGSSFELVTQLIIAGKRNYINEQNLNKTEEKIQEFQKMAIGFKKTLNPDKQKSKL